MATTLFQRDLGRTQGRIEPAAFAPVEGAFAFVLGSDAPGVFGRFMPGDFAEVAQTVDLTGMSFIRFAAALRGPSVAPAHGAWRFAVLLDGVEQYGELLPIGRLQTRFDRVIDVSSRSGVADLSFRMELTDNGTELIESELPAVYLDRILGDVSVARPVLADRLPEPGDPAAPRGGPITFDLIDVGHDGIDPASVRVLINGVVAMKAGVAQPGFDGPGAGFAVSGDALSVALVPTADFPSRAAVPVHVEAATRSGLAGSFDYAFTVEDYARPWLTGAQALAQKRVQVSFDDAVRQQGDGDPTDALTPGNYAIAAVSAPAMLVEVASVEAVSPSSALLHLDTELSAGATYEVSAASLTSLAGQEVTPDAASFTGFSPTIPSGRRFDLYRLLPQMNRDEDTGDLKKLTSALQDVTDLLLADVDRFPDILDPDLAPQPFLSRMLDDMGNPFPFDLEDLDQRRLLSVLVSLYREKGTAQGIRDAIRFFLGIEVDSIDSFHGTTLILGESALGVDWEIGPDKRFDLYAFDVTVGRALSDTERRRIRFLVDYLKPAHTHFIDLIEPMPPEVIDHLELGLSELGVNWRLH